MVPVVAPLRAWPPRMGNFENDGADGDSGNRKVFVILDEIDEI